MYTKSVLAALAAAPAIVSAGNAIVMNKCSSDVFAWSVSDDGASMQTIAPGASYSEAYYKPSSGGVSMKLSMENMGPYPDKAITQFEYTLEGMIWYDISNINGYPFQSGGVTLVPGESSCPTKTCPAGQALCGDAYNTPDENDATGACSADSDTTLILCSDDPTSSSTSEDVAAPVADEKVAAPKEEEAAVSKAAPSSSVAPVSVALPSSTPVAAPVTTAAPVVAAAPDAGVYTTFVTQVVTVAARDAAPEPTGIPLKRDESHVNMHKRAAHRHHFHRHGADVN